MVKEHDLDGPNPKPDGGIGPADPEKAARPRQRGHRSLPQSGRTRSRRFSGGRRS
jgi:hypothetical protein